MLSLLLMTACPSVVDTSSTDKADGPTTPPKSSPTSPPSIPIISFKIPDQTIMKGSSIHLDISHLTPRGATIGVAEKPVWLFFDDESKIFTGTAPSQPSRTTVKGTYKGENGALANWSFRLIVGDIDLNFSTQTATLGVPYRYDLSEAVGTSTVTITRKPSWLSYDDSLKVFSGTPTGTPGSKTVSGFYNGTNGSSYHWNFEIFVLDEETDASPFFRISTLTYKWGERIDLVLSNYVSNFKSGMRITVDSKPHWLIYNSNNFRLHGVVPQLFTQIQISGTILNHPNPPTNWTLSLNITQDETIERKAYLWPTSMKYNGNLGGLSGANSKCRGNIPAGLPAGLIHQAVLETTTSTPSSMLNTGTEVYAYRSNGTTKVVNSWEIFFSSIVAANDSITGNSNDEYWTGAGAQIGTGDNCSDWTYESNDQSATIGNGAATNSQRWSGSTSTCELEKKILCVSY